jgi:hypothetical protein
MRCTEREPEALAEIAFLYFHRVSSPKCHEFD